MKRLFCILLALILLLSLTACGDKEPKDTETTEQTETAAPESEPITVEEILEALDKAESSEDFKKLIDAMEGVYADDEEITYEGESFTLAQIKEYYEAFKSIEDAINGVDDTTNAVTPDADSPAIGIWKGTYRKFVGDSVENASDEPFALELRDNGTGTHYREGTSFDLTWTLDGEDFAMTETFLGSIDYTGTLTDGVLHIFNGDPSNDLTYEYVYEPGSQSDIDALK